ncbi:MAG: hydroxycarboxylate dehydrogenase [Burkholderiales bacterium]
MADVHLIDAARLRAAVTELMRGFGSDAREIELVTDNLIQANLTGHDSHGVGMLPRYVDAYLEGGLRPNARVETRLDSGAMLSLDGNAGFGQVIGHDAMEIAIARAKQYGSCIAALGNSHHLCRIGAWAEMAVAEGLISIHFVNVISRPIVAPWGGTDARFGTNPFAVGIPVRDGEPIVLDFATSIMAQGKVRVAYNKGEQLPDGRLLDDKGDPTTDPKFGVIDPTGAIVTFGEHKGFGLALICEVLGGALAGGLTCHEAGSGKKRVLNGMLTIVLDPSKLSDGPLFGNEMQAFLDWVRQSPPQQGVDRVRVPGEPERESRARRLAEGIPVDATTWKEILAAGEKLGVKPSLLSELAGT